MPRHLAISPKVTHTFHSAIFNIRNGPRLHFMQGALALIAERCGNEIDFPFLHRTNPDQFSIAVLNDPTFTSLQSASFFSQFLTI